MVGRVPVYLLDTNLEVNHPDDRALMNKLYAGGPELRLRQEWILGVGGVRVLRAVGIEPAVWHANEGHAAFMFVERLREQVAGRRLRFEDAVSRRCGRAACSPRTRRCRPATTSSRWTQLVKVAGPVWEALGVDHERFFELGAHAGRRGQLPHDRVRGAARRAGQRRLAAARPGLAQPLAQPLARPPWEAVPIGHVTNGVHLPTWMASAIMALLDEHLGPRLARPPRRHRRCGIGCSRSTTSRLWRAHLELKAVLRDFIREDARHRFAGQLKEAAAGGGRRHAARSRCRSRSALRGASRPTSAPT